MFFLVLAVGVALAFEFVNGFHDTANAVATVIYTRSLRARWAVLFSGILNFCGVMLAGVGVAYSIVNLFPLDHLMTAGGVSQAGLALIFSVLGAAILWNLGTWWLGIPASSSHALIGSILGASMGFCMHQGLPLETGVPWDKARQVMAALFFSPLLGFFCSALLLRLITRFDGTGSMFEEGGKDHKPPLGIRALLILSCGGVSFAHGSNDGQKGMGLVMLILMGLAPASFCLDLSASTALNQRTAVVCREAASALPPAPDNVLLRESLLNSASVWEHPLSEIPPPQRAAFRLQTRQQIRALKASSDPRLQGYGVALEGRLNYVCSWVKVAVAMALGLGTMIGWKRVVVTLGERIGKSHLNYGQGVSAQVVAAGTILLADVLKMPVSTTHVLSSGIAGAMFGQRAGLQPRTLWQIGLAWILTLPVCISLGLGLYLSLA